MSNIIFNNVNYHYSNPYNQILTSFSLNISINWKTALIGRNGSGKTTLLKLLCKSIQPSSGNIISPKEIVYFPNTPINTEEITFSIIKENIAPFTYWEKIMVELLKKDDNDSLQKYAEYLELYNFHKGYTIDSILEKEFYKIGLTEEQFRRPFNTLSGGEQTRALIISIFLRDGSFPLLDEPTDHLDIEGREKLAIYLQQSKKGFIIASHDRNLFDSCVDHVVSLSKSQVEVMNGNYSVWKYQKELEEGSELRRSDNLQREINDLEKAAIQKRRWSDKKERKKNSFHDSGFVSHKASKMMKRALSIEKRIQDNINQKKDLLNKKEIVYSLKMKKSGKTPEKLVSINNLSASIDGRIIFSNLYLNLHKGDRLSIKGKNGSGKSTLLKIIDESRIIKNENIYTAPNISIGRAYQFPLWGKGYLKDILSEANIDITSFRFIMSAFSLKGDIFDFPLETFSRGQIRKIDLCRTIVSSPQLLIWDEPLNYLDIYSREQVEEFLLSQELSIIFVEHDQKFIENVATEIITLE